MRHAKQGRKLNRTSSHRKAMFANMATSLITHEQIKTTLPKAKELKPIMDKLITLGNAAICMPVVRLLRSLQDQAAVRKLFDVLAARYTERPGGYTRVLKAGYRFGDNAPVAIIELVDRDVEAKGAEDRARVEAEDAAETVAA